MRDFDKHVDVLVIGAGNAGLCAALAALEQGVEVLVIERANEAERGGNSAYTAGAFRVVYEGTEDLARLMPELAADELDKHDFGSYSAGDFLMDMARVTQYRADPELTECLIADSQETLLWMQSYGVRFMPMYQRQAFQKADGAFRFWGGLTVESYGGGAGLVGALFDAVEKLGGQVWYESRAVELVHDLGHGVVGAVIHQNGKAVTVGAKGVVLAAGGFEANTEWRTRYLGPGWDLAKVRGSRHNTGDGIRMALDVGAEPYGQWSGSHAVSWDLNAPPYGDLAVGDGFQKHSYPFGIMVNADGQRFVDEGADFRNYTYAKYGAEVLKQPGQFAWQVFDNQVLHLLRDEYNTKRVTRVQASSLEDLAVRMEGVDADEFMKTIDDYNAAVTQDVPFDPNVKDGRRTIGLEVDKSNWANLIIEPPFYAYGVTCGVTFTFGGLHIDLEGRVLDMDSVPIPGLFAAGELVGGLFYFNYPGGTGLTSGAVFGRRAGVAAATLPDGLGS